MIQENKFTNCINFDPASGPKKGCPQQNHEYMKDVLRVREGSPSTYLPQNGERAFKANELCKN
jgi:hypothetical protein